MITEILDFLFFLQGRPKPQAKGLSPLSSCTIINHFIKLRCANRALNGKNLSTMSIGVLAS